MILKHAIDVAMGAHCVDQFERTIRIQKLNDVRDRRRCMSRCTWLQLQLELVDGIEPTTFRLRNECSTAKLNELASDAAT